MYNYSGINTCAHCAQGSTFTAAHLQADRVLPLAEAELEKKLACWYNMGLGPWAPGFKFFAWFGFDISEVDGFQERQSR